MTGNVKKSFHICMVDLVTSCCLYDSDRVKYISSYFTLVLDYTHPWWGYDRLG